MHVHGGPVPWTVYLHGKVLGGQGGQGGAWKLAPPAGGCAGPHHGCLSKSRMVISPRFMCHPMPSDRGPLTVQPGGRSQPIALGLFHQTPTANLRRAGSCHD